MERLRCTELHVNLKQIAENYRSLVSLSENNFVCPMLKANAYGHGAIQVANQLRDESCQFFGVALYEEAIELRQSGIEDTEILVFAPLEPGCIRLAIENKLTPVLLSDNDFEILKTEMAGESQVLKVHLKLNISMNRLGFSLEKAADLIKHLRAISSVRLQGLCTHFPCAEDLLAEAGQTTNEINQFLDFSGFYDIEYLHSLNSAALLGLHTRDDERRHKLGARPGIALYGALPKLNLKQDLPIHEALTLSSRIQHLQKVKRGQAVSYMGQWVAPEDSLVGIIPIGYADGVRRGLSGRINVKMDGDICPQVGIICMDYIMVNLTYAKNKNALGAGVQLLLSGDKKLSTQSWADELNTIPYEIMTGMSSRLPRVYS